MDAGDCALGHERTSRYDPHVLQPGVGVRPDTHLNAPADPVKIRGEILVTGATGFIGSALVGSLLDQGHAVRALVRRAGNASRLRKNASERLREIMVTDLGSHSDWDPVLDGVAAVVHLAGAAHLPHQAADRSVYETNNVVATERLAAAAARAGVKRFVLASSVKVNGERTLDRPFSEETPPRPEDEYGRSKLEAEKRLLAIAASTSLEAVVLRPPLVYGPGVKANFLALLRLVDRGLPLPLAAIRNRRSLLYLGNLTSAIEACLAHPSAPGNVFLVADDDAVSTPGLVRAMAKALDRPARLFSFPLPVLAAVATLTGQRHRFERVSESLELDTAKIRSQLGWRPPHGFSEGIAETCRWFAAARG